MSLIALQFVFLNSTTVENLSRKVKVWSLAVYIPRPKDLPAQKPFRTVTYPLTTSPDVVSTRPLRTFAILHTKPGENPFDLGYYRNFKSVMGNTVFDWFFPLRYSPCADHTSGKSDFALGRVVQRMREEAGLASPGRDNEGRRRCRYMKPRRSSMVHGRHNSLARNEDLQDRTAPWPGDAASSGRMIKSGDEFAPGHPLTGEGSALPKGRSPEEPELSGTPTLPNGHLPGDVAAHYDDGSPRDGDVHQYNNP